MASVAALFTESLLVGPSKVAMPGEELALFANKKSVYQSKSRAKR